MFYKNITLRLKKLHDYSKNH